MCSSPSSERHLRSHLSPCQSNDDLQRFSTSSNDKCCLSHILSDSAHSSMMNKESCNEARCSTISLTDNNESKFQNLSMNSSRRFDSDRELNGDMFGSLDQSCGRGSQVHDELGQNSIFSNEELVRSDRMHSTLSSLTKEQKSSLPLTKISEENESVHPCQAATAYNGIICEQASPQSQRARVDHVPKLVVESCPDNGQKINHWRSRGHGNDKGCSMLSSTSVLSMQSPERHKGSDSDHRTGKINNVSEDGLSKEARQLKRYEASIAKKDATQETKDLIWAIMRDKVQREVACRRSSIGLLDNQSQNKSNSCSSQINCSDYIQSSLPTGNSSLSGYLTSSAAGRKNSDPRVSNVARKIQYLESLPQRATSASRQIGSSRNLTIEYPSLYFDKSLDGYTDNASSGHDSSSLRSCSVETLSRKNSTDSFVSTSESVANSDMLFDITNPDNEHKRFVKSVKQNFNVAYFPTSLLEVGTSFTPSSKNRQQNEKDYQDRKWQRGKARKLTTFETGCNKETFSRISNKEAVNSEEKAQCQILCQRKVPESQSDVISLTQNSSNNSGDKVYLSKAYENSKGDSMYKGQQTERKISIRTSSRQTMEKKKEGIDCTSGNTGDDISSDLTPTICKKTAEYSHSGSFIFEENMNDDDIGVSPKTLRSSPTKEHDKIKGHSYILPDHVTQDILNANVKSEITNISVQEINGIDKVNTSEREGLVLKQSHTGNSVVQNETNSVIRHPPSDNINTDENGNLTRKQFQISNGILAVNCEFDVVHKNKVNSKANEKTANVPSTDAFDTFLQSADDLQNCNKEVENVSQGHLSFVQSIQSHDIVPDIIREKYVQKNVLLQQTLPVADVICDSKNQEIQKEEIHQFEALKDKNEQSQSNGDKVNNTYVGLQSSSSSSPCSYSLKNEQYDVKENNTEITLSNFKVIDSSAIVNHSSNVNEVTLPNRLEDTDNVINNNDKLILDQNEEEMKESRETEMYRRRNARLNARQRRLQNFPDITVEVNDKKLESLKVDKLPRRILDMQTQVERIARHCPGSVEKCSRDELPSQEIVAMGYSSGLTSFRHYENSMENCKHKVSSDTIPTDSLQIPAVSSPVASQEDVGHSSTRCSIDSGYDASSHSSTLERSSKNQTDTLSTVSNEKPFHMYSAEDNSPLADDTVFRLDRIINESVASKFETSGHTGEVSGHKGDMSGHIGEISGHTGERSRHTGEVSGHTGEVREHTAELSRHTGEVTGYTVKMNGQTDEMSGNTGELSGCPEELSRHTGEVSRFTDEPSGHTGEGSGYTGEVSGYTGEVSGHTGEVSGHTGEVSGYTGEVSGHTGEVSGYTDCLSGFKGESDDNTWLTKHVEILKTSDFSPEDCIALLYQSINAKYKHSNKSALENCDTETINLSEALNDKILASKEDYSENYGILICTKSNEIPSSNSTDAVNCVDIDTIRSRYCDKNHELLNETPLNSRTENNCDFVIAESFTAQKKSTSELKGESRKEILSPIRSISSRNIVQRDLSYVTGITKEFAVSGDEGDKLASIECGQRVIRLDDRTEVYGQDYFNTFQGQLDDKSARCVERESDVDVRGSGDTKLSSASLQLTINKNKVIVNDLKENTPRVKIIKAHQPITLQGQTVPEPIFESNQTVTSQATTLSVAENLSVLSTNHSPSSSKVVYNKDIRIDSNNKKGILCADNKIDDISEIKVPSQLADRNKTKASSLMWNPLTTFYNEMSLSVSNMLAASKILPDQTIHKDNKSQGFQNAGVNPTQPARKSSKSMVNEVVLNHQGMKLDNKELLHYSPEITPFASTSGSERKTSKCQPVLIKTSKYQPLLMDIDQTNLLKNEAQQVSNVTKTARLHELEISKTLPDYSITADLDKVICQLIQYPSQSCIRSQAESIRISDKDCKPLTKTQSDSSSFKEKLNRVRQAFPMDVLHRTLRIDSILSSLQRIHLKSKHITNTADHSGPRISDQSDIRAGDTRIADNRFGDTRLADTGLGYTKLGVARLGDTSPSNRRFDDARLGDIRLRDARLEDTGFGKDVVKDNNCRHIDMNISEELHEASQRNVTGVSQGRQDGGQNTVRQISQGRQISGQNTVRQVSQGRQISGQNTVRQVFSADNEVMSKFSPSIKARSVLLTPTLSRSDGPLSKSQTLSRCDGLPSKSPTLPRHNGPLNKSLTLPTLDTLLAKPTSVKTPFCSSNIPLTSRYSEVEKSQCDSLYSRSPVARSVFDEKNIVKNQTFLPTSFTTFLNRLTPSRASQSETSIKSRSLPPSYIANDTLSPMRNCGTISNENSPSLARVYERRCVDQSQQQTQNIYRLQSLTARDNEQNSDVYNLLNRGQPYEDVCSVLPQRHQLRTSSQLAPSAKYIDNRNQSPKLAPATECIDIKRHPTSYSAGVGSTDGLTKSSSLPANSRLDTEILLEQIKMKNKSKGFSLSLVELKSSDSSDWSTSSEDFQLQRDKNNRTRQMSTLSSKQRHLRQSAQLTPQANERSQTNNRLEAASYTDDLDQVLSSIAGDTDKMTSRETSGKMTSRRTSDPVLITDERRKLLTRDDSFNEPDSPQVERKLPLPTESNIMRHRRQGHDQSRHGHDQARHGHDQARHGHDQTRHGHDQTGMLTLRERRRQKKEGATRKKNRDCSSESSETSPSRDRRMGGANRCHAVRVAPIHRKRKLKRKGDYGGDVAEEKEVKDKYGGDRIEIDRAGRSQSFSGQAHNVRGGGMSEWKCVGQTHTVRVFNRK